MERVCPPCGAEADALYLIRPEAMSRRIHVSSDLKRYLDRLGREGPVEKVEEQARLVAEADVPQRLDPYGWPYLKACRHASTFAAQGLGAAPEPGPERACRRLLHIKHDAGRYERLFWQLASCLHKIQQSLFNNIILLQSRTTGEAIQLLLGLRRNRG